MSGERIETEITKLFKIQHPILLAGMNNVAGPKLAAAVSNAGGLGVIGGVGYTPKMMRKMIKELKEYLTDKNLPFGVDLLLPQVGGKARKTNYDYTNNTLPELVDIIIEEGASLFVSAVGVPPRWVVEKFHKHGIPVMNMIGSPKHAEKALAVGVDIICAQGHEGGGHTGNIPTSVLIPQVVDIVKGKKSELWNIQVPVIAAGGIYDGRGLAMSFSLGAQAVWVGTRFVNSVEASVPDRIKNEVIKCKPEGTLRTIIFTGRPMRVIKNPYIEDYEVNRQEEIKQLTSKGIIPYNNDIKTGRLNQKDAIEVRPILIGQAAGAIQDTLPAKTIIDNMVGDAVNIMRQNAGIIKPKL